MHEMPIHNLIWAIFSSPSRERIHFPPGEEEGFIFKIDFFEGICHMLVSRRVLIFQCNTATL